MRKRPQADERGQATVEFALIIPLLILVIVGLIEFGKAFNYWISLNQLAGDGARWAAVGKVPGNAAPTQESDFKTYITSQMLTGELRSDVANTANGGGIIICFVPVSPGATTASAGDAIRVTITAPHPIKLVFMPALTDVKLKGVATMRLEQTPAVNWPKCA